MGLASARIAVDRDGQILTKYHLVQDAWANLAKLFDGTLAETVIAGTAPEMLKAEVDVELLHPTPTKGSAVATIEQLARLVDQRELGDELVLTERGGAETARAVGHAPEWMG